MKGLLDRFVFQLAIVMMNQKGIPVDDEHIRLKLGTHTAKGSYGDYWKLSETRGIKVLRKDFNTIKQAKNSNSMAEAQLESDFFIKSKKTGVVPECFGTRIVMVGSHFRVGILMEHLGETRLMDYRGDADHYQVRKQLEQKFIDIGIQRNDLHNENIMVKDGKFYAIDFTPFTVTILDEKKAA